MLPSNLLTVWKRRETIQPRFASLTTDKLRIAKTLIETYKQGLGKKKIALKKVGEKLEDEGFDFHFVRGLSILLDRRSAFKCSSQTNPVELRREIFQAAGKTGPATNPKRRRTIIENLASEMQISRNELEESMYADLENELTLQHFSVIEPQELLEKYNLSLAQTLLFDATELKFTVSGNWQNIFFKAKRLGLIYDAYKSNEFWVKVDGPASLFKLTRRYGTAIAKLLPTIIKSPKWTIEAKILWKFTNTIYNFKLESWKHNNLFGPQQETEAFDSSIEENFANRFQALNSEWKLKREPEPIIADQHVFIPDFSFEREKIKLYMEVVGFWTKEYLMRKITKLKKIDERILVTVDETLACERLTKLEKQQNLDIIYYRKKIPLPPILQYLQEAYKNTHAKHMKLLREHRIDVTEPIIKFEDFAFRMGVSKKAARTQLIENPPENYAILPDGLVRRDKLQQIKDLLNHEISETGELSLKEAKKITKEQGIDLTSTIKTLGFKVIWHGINEEKAVIVKSDNKSAR